MYIANATIISEANELMLRSAAHAASDGFSASVGLEHRRNRPCVPEESQIRKDHLWGIEKPDMPLALSLRGRLWAAAAVCRKAGGTSIEQLCHSDSGGRSAGRPGAVASTWQAWPNPR
jgi:hypothetical protein